MAYLILSAPRIHWPPPFHVCKLHPTGLTGFLQATETGPDRPKTTDATDSHGPATLRTAELEVVDPGSINRHMFHSMEFMRADLPHHASFVCFQFHFGDCFVVFPFPDKRHLHSSTVQCFID